MYNRTMIQSLLSEVFQYAISTFGKKLDSVILYGSYAREEADSESDVDIMILVNVSAEELSEFRYACNCFGTYLDLKYGVLTSMLLQDTETFYKWKDVLPFYQNVIREGVKIVA